MNSGELDIFDDILSDDDSFFEEQPKRSSSTVTKKSSTSIFDKPEKGTDDESNKDEKNLNDDWLGLGQPKKVSDIIKTDSKNDWLGISEIINEAPSKESEKKPIKKISFEDDDDILGTLGLNKKPTEEPKKTDFLESILKPSTKKDEIDVPVRPKTTGDIKSSNSTDPLFGTNLPREGRRKRISSSGLVDPLGLFSESKEESKIEQTHSYSSTDIKNIENTPSTKSQLEEKSKSVSNIQESSGLPDWLGGSKVKTVQEVQSVKTKTEIIEKTDTTPKEQIKESPNILDTFLSQQKLTQSNIEYQNVTTNLQQQETQLLMALQMKKYEDNLKDIQKQQKEILIKQEHQFNSLIERQLTKQQAMENNMRLQQERINSHIQLLLTQPNIDIPEEQLKEKIEKTKKTVEEEQIKSYENMIENLRQRQHEELFILEESYKKQISLLEDSMNNTENKLKTELESSFKKNEEIITLLQERHDNVMEKFKKRIEVIEEEHAKEIKLLRENHTRVIDEIKFEHNLVIENIKESKRSEAIILKETGDFGQKLDNNIQLLANNSQILQNVVGKFENDYSIFNKIKEETLAAKEKEIELMRINLEKCREMAETERVQLLSFIRNLETKIAEQNHTFKEDRWTLQQAISTLATRTAAFDREVEFSKTTIEREREQLKTLKESLLAEQEKIILQLTEEKLLISAEKSRLETSNKLNINFDSKKEKAELEAAIKLTKDTNELIEKERLTLQNQIYEVETLKRNLQDRERKILQKEIELTKLTKVAEEKFEEGERAKKEATESENRCTERMKQLQIQLIQLTNREKKLSEDKISLSKERISLNTLMRQNKTCSLCIANEKPTIKENWNSDLIRHEEIPFTHFDVTESDIFRLQFEDKDD